LRATALPGELVEAQSRANSRCEKVWRQARQDSDYASVKPYLAEVLKLVREAARLWAEKSGSTPYDALMEGFQPGVGAAEMAPVFARYETFLRGNLEEIEARQAAKPAPIAPAAPFPADRQEALRCAASFPSASGLITPMPGSIDQRIRFRAARRPIRASPRVMTSPISPARCLE
jgi:carboxypeptidase Taq